MNIGRRKNLKDYCKLLRCPSYCRKFSLRKRIRMIMGKHVGDGCTVDNLFTRCCLLYCAGKNCPCGKWDDGLTENIIFLVFKIEIEELKRSV